MEENKGQILLYQTIDGGSIIEVTLCNDTVWLTIRSNGRIISAELAKKKANLEYDKFKERISNQLSPVEIHFIENFEKEQKKLRRK